MSQYLKMSSNNQTPYQNIFLKGIILTFLLLASACSSDLPIEPRMLIFIEKLPSTPENLVYEIWYRDGEDYVSIDRFQTQSGTTSLSIPITPQLAEALTLIVTVESSSLVPDEPSDSVLLAGDFVDGEAQLSVSHPLSFGTDFSSAYGTFRLATPTSSQTTDFDQGIWWFDLEGGEPVQSLFLPSLPQGWIYEAWVIGGDEPLSIGKFPDPARFDSDLAGAAASDAVVAPLFPGQDYVNPPELIPGFSALITVEPQPDLSATPFDVEILIDQVIEAIDINQPMENRTNQSLPRGRATRRVEREQ